MRWTSYPESYQTYIRHDLLDLSNRSFADRMLIPTDSRFGSQWHLLNTGQSGGTPGMDINVVDVWDDYTGAGVIVAIVDDSVSYTHPDLDDNYDTALDRDAAENDDDAYPSSADDNHGTAVAGVIAAENNGSNVVGVAYDATIVGLRIGYTASDGPSQPASNYNYAAANGIDVLNNSWGYDGFFSDADDFNNSEFSGLAAGLENLVVNGRDGLGSIVFFSSGNSGDQGQDANYHNLLNSRYTIAVGAIDRTGVITDFSTPGAPVFVVLPGQGIFTTDREGTDGYRFGNFVGLDGTSFSSPIGAGIAALILEANPDLGWRDVQEIFALSAIQIDASHTSWTENGASNWNGGGLHTSRWYGFGLTDTLAAVRMAETWTLQSTSANEVSVSGSSSNSIAIPDLGTITDTITINSGVNIDHVLITLDISHTAPVDLIVTLISPDGTESQLIVQPGLVPGSDTTPQDGTAGDDGVPSANISFTLSSTEFWGETGEGVWTIRIQDSLQQDSGTLNSWSIDLYGDALSDDTTYYFTDEYATFAATDASRRTIVDDTGINTLNTAAVTTDVVLDLSGNTQSTVAGLTLNFAVGTVFHNAYAGDGNDVITGNAFDNNLLGGRGNDTISGGDGSDTVMYFSDSTEFTFSMLSPTEIQVAYTGANGIDEGTDIVTGVEFFQFQDTTLTKAQVITLAGGSVGPVFTSGTTANFAENDVGTAYDADATDDDSAAPTYAITGGADAALFNIDSVTGEVTFKNPPDFETPADAGADNVYDIEITASSDGDDTVQSVAITVTNVNDNSPVFTSGAAANFEEGGTGTAYDAGATDADGDTLAYSISGGGDAALFDIDSVTGQVTFKVAPDFEAPGDTDTNNTYVIDVTASDGSNDATQTVTITVTDLSGPPTFTSGSAADFAENGTGTAYDADATSPDGPAPTYAITGGVDAALFDIDAVTGEVTFKAAPDFETPADSGTDNVYDIEITATSGALDTVQNVAITVTDENDVAPVFTSGTAVSFAENGVGTAYDADATDAEGQTPTYAISGGADAALFDIDSVTGEVTFKNAPDFEAPADAGGDNVYDIEVTANDGVNNTVQSVAITVTDVVNEFNVITGTAGDDDLVGTSGADQINALGGADRLDGGAGTDELNGGEGDDVFLVGVGDGPDTYNGGGGTDTIAAVEAGTVISFAGGAFGPGNSIELITNDDPGAGGSSTTLTGTPGNDTLNVSGETTPYILEGLAGRDTLRGGSADDTLIGGTGNDRLTGNAGADEFVFSDGDGRDQILDFDPSSGDVINLSGVTGLDSFADVQAAMSTFFGRTIITAADGTRISIQGVSIGDFSADDFSFTAPAPSVAGISRDAVVTGTTIGGTSGNDAYDFSATTLTGIDSIDMGAGDDSVVGSSGADVINGDAGDDSLEGGAGNDTLSGGADSDTAVFSGNRADYTATQIDGDSVTVTDDVGTDGTDTVHGVEIFEFADGTITFAELLAIANVPIFTSGSTASFAESGVGVVYDADATDADSAAPTYAITGGADAALFLIDGVTGEVTFDTSPDYEAPADSNGDNVYDIEITASSGGDNTVQAVAITVTNVNDNAPVFTSGTAVYFAESGTGTAYDANATDADGETLTYTISGGADGALFDVDANTGEVTFKTPPDFETPVDAGANNVYDIEVTASDGVNDTMQSVAITVTDVTEGGWTTLTGTAGADVLDASAETTPFILDGLAGNDKLFGGSADDRLIAGEGTDRLTGNGGADEFVFADGDGRNRILDFDPSSGDVINFAGISGFNSFADVQASMTSGFGRTMIVAADGTRIILFGVAVADLSADDFSFTAPGPAIASASPDAFASASQDSFTGDFGFHDILGDIAMTFDFAKLSSFSLPDFDFGDDGFILGSDLTVSPQVEIDPAAMTIDFGGLAEFDGGIIAPQIDTTFVHGQLELPDGSLARLERVMDTDGDSFIFAARQETESSFKTDIRDDGPATIERHFEGDVSDGLFDGALVREQPVEAPTEWDVGDAGDIISNALNDLHALNDFHAWDFDNFIL